MFNLLVIYDDLDTKRGEYFETSKRHLNSRILPTFISAAQYLNTNNCLEQPIDYYTSYFNGQPFIFVAYTHGVENSLLISNSDYIHSRNAYLFNKSLFYACSCLTAKSLGLCLIENGCTAFLGYNATISSCAPETEGIFQECENSFLEHFLNTEFTIRECLKKMYEKYRDMELYLAMNYSALEASILSGNLTAFEILCDESVKDFNKFNFTNNK